MGISNLISKIDFTKKKIEFHSKISKINFQKTPCDKWKTFNSTIDQNVKSLRNLRDACNEYTEEIDKLKKERNLNLVYISNYANYLSDSLEKLKDMGKLKNYDLNEFKLLSKSLRHDCENISKKRSSNKFIEILDHSPTKKAFARFGKELLAFENSVDKTLTNEMGSKVENIISQIEDAIKEQKFDLKINETIYLPNSDEYNELKIDIDLSKFEDEDNRNKYLKEKLNPVKIKFKKFGNDIPKKIDELLYRDRLYRPEKNESIAQGINIEKINLEACKSIIKDAEEMVKNRHFNKNISRKVFEINKTTHKLDSNDISTDFAKFKSEKGKAEHLKKVLGSANNEFLKDYKEGHDEINKFLEEKLNKNFISSLPDGLEECFICHEKINFYKNYDFITLPKCKHIFHKNCLDKQKTSVCPICRKPI